MKPEEQEEKPSRRQRRNQKRSQRRARLEKCRREEAVAAQKMSQDPEDDKACTPSLGTSFLANDRKEDHIWETFLSVRPSR